MTSPAELDSYIQAVRPSTWLVVVASLLAVVAFVVWGFTGRLATTVVDNGIAHDGVVFCFLNASDHELVSPGDRAVVDGQEAGVGAVSTTPISEREAGEYAPDDYARSMLKLEEWNYPVIITMANPPEDGRLVQVTITTDEVSPLSFLTDVEGPADGE